MSDKVFFIVPAAGVGTRFGQSIPKQYQRVQEAPIIEHTLSAIVRLPQIAKVVVALHESDKRFEQLPLSVHPLVKTVVGGQSRCESVYQSLIALKDELQDNDWVAVHDVVRPGLTTRTWQRLMSTIANDECGGLLALPVSDSVKQVNQAHQITHSVSREGLWLAQTPQVFRAKHLIHAFEKFGVGSEMTDEAMLMEKLGLQPLVVRGDSSNIKITYPEDLALFRQHLQQKAFDYDESWAGV